MTNQEQYDKICEDSKRLKALEEKLDRTEKQRNALFIALNYVYNTMKWSADARPEDMENVVKNALLMAIEKSEGSIKLEVKEDDN